MAAGGWSVGPSALHSIGRKAVEAGFVNETPISEADVLLR
jgi:hypothetical protein